MPSTYAYCRRWAEPIHPGKYDFLSSPHPLRNPPSNSVLGARLYAANTLSTAVGTEAFPKLTCLSHFPLPQRSTRVGVQFQSGWFIPNARPGTPCRVTCSDIYNHFGHWWVAGSLQKPAELSREETSGKLHRCARQLAEKHRRTRSSIAECGKRFLRVSTMKCCLGTGNSRGNLSRVYLPRHMNPAPPSLPPAIHRLPQFHAERVRMPCGKICYFIAATAKNTTSTSFFLEPTLSSGGRR